MMPFLALGLLLLPAAASDDGDLRDYTVPLGGGAELRMRTDAHLEAERPLVRHTAGEELVLDSAWGACDGDDDEGGGGCGHATGQKAPNRRPPPSTARSLTSRSDAPAPLAL